VRALAVVSTLPILALLSPFGVGQEPPPIELETQTQRIRVVTIVHGLDSPWSMAFLPNGDILVTERPGRLRLVHEGVLQPQPIAGVPPVQYQAHAGLLDVLLHPNFSSNHLIYLTYAKLGEQGGTTAILRARLDGLQLLDAKDIFVADGSAAVPTSGDGWFLTTRECSMQALATADLLASPSPRTCPNSGDEVNVLRPGLNYGWPVVSLAASMTAVSLACSPGMKEWSRRRFSGCRL
jgi:glucose/arabinose dehydrogenase